MNKKYLAAGLIAGLTAGAGAGFVLEQSGAAGASAPAVTVAAPGTTASGLGVSGAGSPGTGAPAAPPAHDDEIRAALAGLVTDGTLTQAQVDKVVTALDAAEAAEHPGGAGRGGPGGPGGPGRGGRMGAKLSIATVATALGMTEADLRTELQAGKTIADVAKEKGVDVQKIVDAVVAEVKTALDQAVTAGTITQAQEDQRLTDLTTRITDRINGKAPAGGAGPAGGGFPGGMGGRHGHGPGKGDAPAPGAPAPDATSTTTAA
jgi:hypothetical protein